jgi:hypothetical protein
MRFLGNGRAASAQDGPPPLVGDGSRTPGEQARAVDLETRITDGKDRTPDSGSPTAGP